MPEDKSKDESESQEFNLEEKLEGKTTKKNSKKKTTKKTNSTKKRYNKQFYWALGFMVGILVIFLIAYFLFTGVFSSNTFTYKNLTFTKELYGKIPVYHYSYSYQGTNGIVTYDLYLRQDPRASNVSTSGAIYFPAGHTTYVALDNLNLDSCQYFGRDLVTFGMFLAGNQIPIEVGVTSPEQAEQYNSTYYNYTMHPDDQTITIKAGNETSIDSTGLHTTITIANCSTTSAIEKFEVKSIIDAKDGKLPK